MFHSTLLTILLANVLLLSGSPYPLANAAALLNSWECVWTLAVTSPRASRMLPGIEGAGLNFDLFSIMNCARESPVHRFWMLYVQIIYRLIKKFPISGSRRWESAADGLFLGKVRTRVKCQRSCCRLGTPTTSHSVQFAVLKRMLFECSGLMERAVKIFWGDQYSDWPAGNHLSQNGICCSLVLFS